MRPTFDKWLLFSMFLGLSFADWGCSQKHPVSLMEINESVVTFRLPDTWRKITGAELDKFRRQVQAQNYAQARSLGYSDPADFAITHFAMFSAREEEIAAVIIIGMQVPSSLKKSYLDVIYESTKTQLYSRSVNVFVHKKTEIDGIPVVESDVEGTGGSRIIVYNFWTPVVSAQAAAIQIMIAPGHYSEYKPVIDTLLSSLHVSLQK